MVIDTSLPVEFKQRVAALLQIYAEGKVHFTYPHSIDPKPVQKATTESSLISEMSKILGNQNNSLIDIREV
jgi:hypothetical protein